MVYEGDRIDGVLKKRLVELEERKKKITQLEKAVGEFEQAEPEKRRLEEEHKRQAHRIQELQRAIQLLQAEVDEIPKLESRISSERETNQQFKEEVNRLNRVVKDQTETMNIGN